MLEGWWLPLLGTAKPIALAAIRECQVAYSFMGVCAGGAHVRVRAHGLLGYPYNDARIRP